MAKAMTHPNDDDPPLAEIPRLSLRAPEAALALGISERKLWEKTNSGDVPHVKLDSIILYPVDALREWLSRHAKRLG